MLRRPSSPRSIGRLGLGSTRDSSRPSISPRRRSSARMSRGSQPGEAFDDQAVVAVAQREGRTTSGARAVHRTEASPKSARAMRGTEPRRDLGRGHRCAPGRTRRPWAALVRCNAGRPPLRPLSGRSVGPAGFARRSSPTLTAADGGGSSVARFGPGVRLRGAAEIGGADASQASKSARRTRVRRPNFRATKRPARISS